MSWCRQVNNKSTTGYAKHTPQSSVTYQGVFPCGAVPQSHAVISPRCDEVKAIACEAQAVHSAVVGRVYWVVTRNNYSGHNNSVSIKANGSVYFFYFSRFQYCSVGYKRTSIKNVKCTCLRSSFWLVSVVLVQRQEATWRPTHVPHSHFAVSTWGDKITTACFIP